MENYGSESPNNQHHPNFQIVSLQSLDGNGDRSTEKLETFKFPELKYPSLLLSIISHGICVAEKSHLSVYRKM